jgi:hypothetical protein
MWSKIRNANDIRIGATLQKYPLEGNPEETIDQSDTRNSLTYKVDNIEEVDGPGDTISLVVSTTASPDIHFALSTKMAATTGNDPVLNKLRKEFVEENCWWFYKVDLFKQ